MSGKEISRKTILDCSYNERVARLNYMPYAAYLVHFRGFIALNHKSKAIIKSTYSSRRFFLKNNFVGH